MIYWTIQSNTVLNIIDKKSIFQPDFRQSKLLDDKREKRYKLILDSFNRINQTDYPGLIFGFSYISKTGQPITDVDDFKLKIVDSGIMNMLESDNLYNKDNTLLKVKNDRLFNPILVDFYDYCDSLCPPYWNIIEEDVDKIIKSIKCGFPISSISQTRSLCEKSFYQCHMPNILKEEIIERHTLPL